MENRCNLPFYKKGDKLQFANYKSIMLLCIVYNKLLEFVEKKVDEEHQCGFRANWSTIENISTLEIFLEKCKEYNVV